MTHEEKMVQLTTVLALQNNAIIALQLQDSTCTDKDHKLIEEMVDECIKSIKQCN